MDSRPTLIQLAARKATLQRAIALRRTQSAEITARIVQPLVWLDRALALWRQLSR